MDNLSERQQKILKFIIEFYRKQEFPPTIREIGKQVGISSTSVVNYNLARLEELELIIRRREVSRGLSLNWQRLAELNIVDESYLNPAAIPGTHANGNSATGGQYRIPVLGPIAAGEPIAVEAREPATTDDWIVLTEGLLGSANARAVDELFALRVQGDSMIDASVLDGDIVIIRRQQVATDGEMVAVWIEGDEETTLKYWRLEGENVHLTPANPNYNPIIRPASTVSIKGRVVSVIRHLN